jgi:hypothetical protein
MPSTFTLLENCNGWKDTQCPVTESKQATIYLSNKRIESDIVNAIDTAPLPASVPIPAIALVHTQYSAPSLGPGVVRPHCLRA